MQWKKNGIVYKPRIIEKWAFSHAMVPTPIKINKNEIRVYTTFCDSSGIGRVGFVDFTDNLPLKIIRVSQKPVLDIGKKGTFDENGVLCCSLVRVNKDQIYMYYVGFELGTKIRYRLLTGLAISSDGGDTFIRASNTPILERSNEELYFRGGPYCLYEKNIFKMWYVAGNSWIKIGDREMPSYEIKYIESKDGISWPKKGETHISIEKDDEHGFGRPTIFKKKNGLYQMFYSIRKKSLKEYRLGYAESDDGKVWNRLDDKLNLDVSETGFDNKAIMYTAPLIIKNNLKLFYNGNNFGINGFAMASLIEE